MFSLPSTGPSIRAPTASGEAASWHRKAPKRTTAKPSPRFPACRRRTSGRSSMTLTDPDATWLVTLGDFAGFCILPEHAFGDIRQISCRRRVLPQARARRGGVLLRRVSGGPVCVDQPERQLRPTEGEHRPALPDDPAAVGDRALAAAERRDRHHGGQYPGHGHRPGEPGPDALDRTVAHDAVDDPELYPAGVRRQAGPAGDALRARPRGDGHGDHAGAGLGPQLPVLWMGVGRRRAGRAQPVSPSIPSRRAPSSRRRAGSRGSIRS